MRTSQQRKLTSFRLREDILDRLKDGARRENRSVSNYLESILLDMLYNKPNDETRAAFEEVRSGKNERKYYSSSREMVADILSEA